MNIVFFILGDSLASEFYVPTFWNTLSHLHGSCVNKKNNWDESERVFIQVKVRLKKVLSQSETHPYQSLSTLKFTSPPCKQSVLASLIHRAKALCDQDFLTQELQFLTTIFKENGYSSQQIWWALKTCNTDHQDQRKTHLDCIYTLHPGSIWLTHQKPD